MEILNNRKRYVDYILIVVGTFLMAISVNIVYEPIGLVTGGVSGLAIVIKYISGGIIAGGIPLWFSNMIINVPLFIVAYLVLGKKYVGKTLFATVCFTVALYIVPAASAPFDDILLASVFGGIIGGVGLGLVLFTSATTGGTDLFAAIIHHYFRHYSVARLLMVADGVIVIAGAMIFGLNRALYAVIAVYITTKVMDGILEGVKFAKLAFIITDKYEEISQVILTDMDRGVTGLTATGMYSGQERKMLFCVVSKKEIIQIIDIVSKKDPNAFVIVSDVREVMGEGFIEYKQ